MDPVTHALTCVVLGRAGLNRTTRAATPMLLVSGVMGDLDWMTRFGGAAAFLRGHRTATDSVPGAVVVAVAVAAAFWVAGRKFSRFNVGMYPAFAICATGSGVHLLLDFLDDYGVKLLWPFRSKWYACDVISQVDWWILFFLLAGLLAPELLRLVSEEIGSRSTGRGPRGAIFALACVALVAGCRPFAHARAVAILDSHTYQGETPLRVAAFPSSSDPMLWAGVVQTDNSVFSVDVPLGPGRVFDPESAQAHFKPQPSVTLANAVASPAAREFLDFARFPLASVQPREEGFEVRLRDMRFASKPAGAREIVAVIELNPQNVVTSDRLEFDAMQ